jgi:cold shock protein
VQVVEGVCVRWSDDEGWGVLRSDDVGSDAFAHFSDLTMDGYHTLEPGSRVRFEVEPYPNGQDGFVFRAHDVRPI